MIKVSLQRLGITAETRDTGLALLDDDKQSPIEDDEASS
jgi:hypothetical protein